MYSLLFPWLPRYFIGGLVKSVAGPLIGGAASFFGGERRNTAAQASSREQMDFQKQMSNTAHRRQVKDLRAAGLNPILSAQYGGASTPGGSMYNPQDTLTPAINTGMQLAQTQSNIGLQDSTQILQTAQTQLSEIDAQLRKNLLPASEALSKIADVGLNLINAIQNRVDTSSGAMDDVMQSGSNALAYAIDLSRRFVGEDIPNAVDSLLQAGNDIAATLQRLPDDMIQEVKDFFNGLRERAMQRRRDYNN